VGVRRRKELLDEEGVSRRGRVQPAARAGCGLQALPAKYVSLVEFRLCLSRACLGKMIIFGTKWRKQKGTFFAPLKQRPDRGSPCGVRGRDPLPPRVLLQKLSLRLQKKTPPLFLSQLFRVFVPSLSWQSDRFEI
jgi:hypothetical protein